MQREKPRGKTQREMGGGGRGKEKRLVTAAPSEMSLVQGCAGPRRGPDCFYNEHHPLGYPAAHILGHSPSVPLVPCATGLGT